METPLVVLWLLAGAVFFTVYFRGINLRGIPLAIRVLKGEFDEEDAIGEISHFQALTAAGSGTVGIGLLDDRRRDRGGADTRATETWPGFMESGAEGVAMTSDAFGRTVSWFPIPLAFIAVLFAVSTMISWAYYGMKGWAYLFGEAKRTQRIYSVIFCVFVALGASIKLESVLNFADAMVFVLCVPNVFGLVFLAPVVRDELASLRKRAAELDGKRSGATSLDA